MPTYEFRCIDCSKRVSVYQTYEEYGTIPVECPHCGGHNLQRLLSRLRVVHSEDARMDSLSDPGAWGDIDENDPASMARMMRKMGKELGEDMPPEFDEVVGRLESGETADQIEKSMPDLGADDFGESI